MTEIFSDILELDSFGGNEIALNLTSVVNYFEGLFGY
jgi:hypothetical protein